MSKFLQIENEPFHQPAEPDLVERASWSQLRIRINGRIVTQCFDKQTLAERSHIYVPTFPIAEWLVENWWVLLNEPSRGPELPPVTKATLPWIRRHCLRTADSGTLLPMLFIFNDGRSVRLQWRPDLTATSSSVPVEFVGSGSASVSVADASLVLSNFIGDVLARVEPINDERVRRVDELWNAIRNADADEREFCEIAGRMGINPYDDAEVPDELADLLESSTLDARAPIARDVSEVATVTSFKSQWTRVRSIIEGQRLRESGIQASLPGLDSPDLPASVGYDCARTVRTSLNLADTETIGPIEHFTNGAFGRTLRLEYSDVPPGDSVVAVVGVDDAGAAKLIAPRSMHLTSRRFLAYRAAYLAMHRCESGPRAITRAFTWDQQASRAFAAELLAPRAALAAQVGPVVSGEQTKSLAEKYQVSEYVIRHQLENAGVSVYFDA